jgi:hypothetical protein
VWWNRTEQNNNALLLRVMGDPKLDTIHLSDTTTIPPVCEKPKGTSPT